MLNGKEGRLLRRNNDKDTRMKINILLCDDDKDFLQRISDAVAGQPVPPGASICITKSSNPAEITDRQLSQYHIMFLDIDMDTSHSAARNSRITGSLQMKLFGLSMPAAAMRWCCSRPIARWQR